jgi:hypothetical protein
MTRTTTVVCSKPNQCVSIGIGNARIELDAIPESLEGNAHKKYQQKQDTYFYQDLYLRTANPATSATTRPKKMTHNHKKR